MPKASVILPVWNGEQYVARCIDSIRQQTVEDFECIIVDDGSTDNTAAIISDLTKGDSRFRRLSISHEGLSNARNVGIEHSTADIVFHIDVDDEAMPNMIECATAFLDENDLELAFFDATSQASNDMVHIKSAVDRYFRRRRCYDICLGKNMLGEMAFNNDYVYAVFIQAIRKSAIRKKFLYGLRAQDILYTTQNLFLAKRVGHLPKMLYIKNIVPKSVSLQRHDAKYVWSLLKTILELQKFAETEGNGRNRSLEMVVNRTFEYLESAVMHLKREDWRTIREMPFTERTILANLGRLLPMSNIKKRLENEMPLEWPYVCDAVDGE